MEPIIIGAVAITNHDSYWKYKQIIPKMEDYINRGFDLNLSVGEVLTPFAKSCDTKTHSQREFLNDVIKAVSIFEELFPLKMD